MTQSEKNLRPFLIKAIQAIVQSRSGVKFHTLCLHNVGTRNNLMINVEDDPDIGSTIKQNLGASYAMSPGDRVLLDIIVKKAYSKTGMTLEVWEFHLESFTPLEGNSDTLLRKTASRFVERLGTLLKSILVASRLIPAYRLCVKGMSKGLENCYLIKQMPNSHETLPSDAFALEVLRPALGNNYKTRLIGSLPTSSGFNQLFIRVHYINQPDLSLLYSTPPPPVMSHIVAATHSNNKNITNLLGLNHQSPLNAVMEENEEQKASVNLDAPHNKASAFSLRYVKPAFIENNDLDRQSDEEFDMELPFSDLLLNHEEENSTHHHRHSHSTKSSSIVVGNGTVAGGGASASVQITNNQQPTMKLLSTKRMENLSHKIARFPFVSSGETGFGLTVNGDFASIYAEVRNCDLEMFVGDSQTTTALEQEFDLLDDLDRHERILKEFDDFVAYFHPDNISMPLT